MLIDTETVDAMVQEIVTMLLEVAQRKSDSKLAPTRSPLISIYCSEKSIGKNNNDKGMDENKFRER